MEELKLMRLILEAQLPLPATAPSSLFPNKAAAAAEMTGGGNLTLNIIAGQTMIILLRASRDDV